MRLKDKIAIVVGAGQAPGEGVGNGRATALLFAREGATVVAVDRSLEAAQETVDIIAKEGGKAVAMSADVTKEETLRKMVADVVGKFGRIDVLHNNVGASIAAGDRPLADIEEAAFDNVIAVNLRGTIMTCKHVLPVMRKQQSGVIINISSLADREAHYPFVGYKAAKAGLTAFTKQIAISEAKHGIRVNVICPGLMDTPMAVDTRARTSGRPRADVVAERNARVPLKGGMGTGWDVGYAALFLASDEAKFITGVDLLVDGGAGANVGM